MLDNKIKFVLDHFESSKSYYNPLRNKIKDWDWLFYGIRETPKYKWQSNVADPTTYQAIMVILSKVMNNTFSKTPPFEVYGREQSDEQYAPLIRDLISFQFDKCGFRNKYSLFVLQALIRGTSIAKTYWKKDTKKITYREPIEEPVIQMAQDPMSGMMLPKVTDTRIVGYDKKKKVVSTYDDPYFEVVDIRDFFPEPDATDTNGTMIHRTYKTLDELKKLGIYKNLDKIKENENADSGEWSYDHPRLNELGLSSPEGHRIFSELDRQKKLNKLVEVLECHCKYDRDGDGELEDCIITVANQNTLIRDIENPFYHGESCFVKVVYEPVLNEFFGRGVCEISEDMQNELNDKRNQRLDNINLVLQPVMKYVEGLIHPALVKNFRYAPGAKLPVRDINASAWDRPPDVTMGVHKEIQDLKQDIQETLGAVPAVSPGANSNDVHRNTSGIMILQGMAGERLKPVVELMDEMGLKKIVQKFHQLNQQFITEERVIRILGEKGADYKRIPAEAHNALVDFIPAGTKEIANKEMNLMQLVRFIEVASKIPNLNVALNYDEIGKEITSLFGFQNKNFIKSKQEIYQAQVLQKKDEVMKTLMGAKAKGMESATRPQNPIAQMSGGAGGADQTRQMMSQTRGGM
jgi:hypothetical protein